LFLEILKLRKFLEINLTYFALDPKNTSNAVQKFENKFWVAVIRER
jgi:hypothetical protein